MEALGIFKFWRNNEARNASSFTDDDDGHTDDDGSLFDLVLKSPDTKGQNEIESPRDVFLSSTTKNDIFSNSKPSSPVSTLRSAPKFNVFMLGFRKSSKTSSDKAESNVDSKASPLMSQFCKSSSKLGQSNRFSLIRRVEEERAANTTPVFARDNSLRSKMLRENTEYDDVVQEKSSVPKYLKLIKPLVSKKASKSSTSVTASSSPVIVPVNLSPRKLPEGSRAGSFKILTRKNLVKGRSAVGGVEQPSVQRRDDSLLEQHDGIQGAILHCKKSFASLECSQLSLSSSDPWHEKLRGPARNSCEETKRCSI